MPSQAASEESENGVPPDPFDSVDEFFPGLGITFYRAWVAFLRDLDQTLTTPTPRIPETFHSELRDIVMRSMGAGAAAIHTSLMAQWELYPTAVEEEFELPDFWSQEMVDELLAEAQLHPPTQFVATAEDLHGRSTAEEDLLLEAAAAALNAPEDSAMASAPPPPPSQEATADTTAAAADASMEESTAAPDVVSGPEQDHDALIFGGLHPRR